MVILRMGENDGEDLSAHCIYCHYARAPEKSYKLFL